MANKRPHPKRAIVDFDGTICGMAFPDSGPPELHVKEGLQMLRDAGFEIVIHSVSINRNWGCESRWHHTRRIVDYMLKYNLPYDRIELKCDKPFAAVYIDDRGVGHHGDWLKTAKEAIERGLK